MSSTAAAAGIGLVGLVLMASVAAPAQMRSTADDLEQRVDRLVGHTLEDMSVRTIRVDDAHGIVEEDRVDELVVAVRVGGLVDQVDLDALVVTHRTERLEVADVDALRDADGSVEAGIVDERDLVQITLDVEPVDWGWDRTREIVFHPSDARAQAFAFTTPVHDDDAVVALDVDERTAT